MSSGVLTPVEARLLTAARRARRAYPVALAVGLALVLSAAGYSVGGLRSLHAGTLEEPPRVPAHLERLARLVGPDRERLLPAREVPPVERLLRERLLEEGYLRLHLVLILWYALIGMIGVTAGLLLASLSFVEMRWLAIVEKLAGATGQVPGAGGRAVGR